MDMVVTQNREIKAMDTDVLNHKLHVTSLIVSMADLVEYQEFLAFGLSKGAVILLNVRQLSQVYVRLTIHREAIILIKYLPAAAVFVSYCEENSFKIWRCHPLKRKAQIILDFKITKKIRSV